MSSVARVFLLVIALLLVAWLYALQRRIARRSPSTIYYRLPPRSTLLQSKNWRQVDTLKGVPAKTGSGYLIVGGSGDVGSDLVRLLRKRGDTAIRVIDISTPPEDILDDLDYERCDVTNLHDLRRAMTKPLRQTKKAPTVVLFTAASIRFWDIWPSTLHLSQAVNLHGVENALEVLSELPGDGKRFVYCSSIASKLPKKSFFPFGPEPATETRSDEEPLMREERYVGASYNKSKRQGNIAVLRADGAAGMRTGVLLPGMGIIGPRGVFVASYLRLFINPCWGHEHAQTAISSVDCARAMLLYDDGLQKRPQDCAGQAFAVTGSRQAWRFRDVWSTVELFAGRRLWFIAIPDALMFIAAYLVMFFVHSQYHFLRALGLGATLTPKWLGIVIMLQPGIFETATRDVVVDDTRFRRVFNYEPVLTTAQAIARVVDEYESGSRAAATGPIQLPQSTYVKRSRAD